MKNPQLPPAYNSRGSNGPPPAYTAPTQFLIGTSQTDSPLVNVPEIKGHLALLRMFAELKNEVAELGPDSAPYIPTDKEKRWSWFVALAVERCVSISTTRWKLFDPFCFKRFDTWCRALRLEDARRSYEEIMPPLDVIMVISSCVRFLSRSLTLANRSGMRTC
jgi:hypothetical protein